MLRELGCVMWREKVRPFDPPLPRGLRPVGGGWLWRSTGDDSGDGGDGDGG